MKKFFKIGEISKLYGIGVDSIRYYEEIGIIKKSSHKARKTYISALLDGKVNLNTVREMVGHSDERTTLGNYCFDRNTEIEKANLIEKALAC